MAVETLSLAPRDSTVYLLNCGMDYPSLIGIHRLKACLTTCLDSLECELSAENLKSFFSLFTVIAGVDGYLVVGILNMVCNKSGKILECIQSLASSADNKADILALKVDYDARVLCFFHIKRNFLKSHCIEHILEKLLSGIRRRYLDKCPDLSRTAAEKSEDLLLSSLQELKFCLIGLDAELFAGIFLCSYFCIADTDCFSDQVVTF